jgi:tripartite-type tricarboxylate transporter receptor subunit TctC
MKRRQFTALAATGVMTLGAPCLLAQDRTIKILVGFPPGGSVDVIARLLADKLRVSLGQNVIVDNKPGAGGRVALGELRRAAPDGQTLALSPSGALVIQPWLFQNLGYDPVKDFTALSRVSVFDFAVTAGPGAPPGDLKAVLAWMKANTDKANYATSCAGTVPHFAGVLLSQAAGVPMTHVAYRGGAPAVADLIGGQVPLMVDTAFETLEHHKAGKVRIIAVTGEQRTKALPEVPTLKELGINIAADAFFGLYGPAGMPAELVTRIDRAVADALRAPDVQEKINSFGQVPSHAAAAELAATQAAHYRRWEAPIKASGFKAE